jgi:hypothetical protein
MEFMWERHVGVGGKHKIKYSGISIVRQKRGLLSKGREKRVERTWERSGDGG